MSFKCFHWKYLIKYSVYTLLVGIFAVFVFVVSFFVKLHNADKPKVYSTSQAGSKYTQVRNDITEMIQTWFDVEIPDNAEDLYFAQRGSFMGYEQYAAFRLNSTQEITTFCDSINIDMNELKQSKSLSEIPGIDYYNHPAQWEEKYQDSNWKLSEGNDFLSTGIGGGFLDILVYVPHEYRIYMFYQAGP